MKIAIAMFGIPRGSSVTMPTIEEHFIRPAQAAGECRVFHHLYLQDRVINPRSGEEAAMPGDAYEPFEDFDGELEAPEHCLALHRFEQIKAFGDFYEDGFRSIRNLVHQLHSLQRVTRRVADWQPDVVLFLRPDLRYASGFSAAELERVAARPRRCVIPDWHWWSGYNDRFALCGSQIYRDYGERIDRVIEYCRSTGRPLHSERLVRYALQRGGASVRTTPAQASRVRVDGQVKPEDFAVVPTAASHRRRMELAWLGVLQKIGA